MITDKKKTPIEIFIQEDSEEKMYGINQDECVKGMVKYIREDMAPSKEEMFEFAKNETFHLDDRLCPFDRETLRAEAWLMGYYFAKRHQKTLTIEEVNKPDKPESSEDDDYYNKIKEVLSLAFMDFLDKNKPEKKMCLSNGECFDIDNAFNEQNWKCLFKYFEKYKKTILSQEVEEANQALCGMCCGCC